MSLRCLSVLELFEVENNERLGTLFAIHTLQLVSGLDRLIQLFAVYVIC